MTIKFTWRIPYDATIADETKREVCHVASERDGLINVIVGIPWRLVAEDDETGRKLKTDSVVTFDTEADPDDFTPYEQMTTDDIVAIVFRHINRDDQEQQLRKRMLDKKHPVAPLPLSKVG